MPEPVHIAAIDAGSNAVRLSIVRAYSALDIEPLHNERYPLPPVGMTGRAEWTPKNG